MKASKINFVFFLVFIFSQSVHANEAKDNVMSFLTSFNTYASDNYNIKYSPTELSIKKAIDALVKIADSDFLMLEDKKYSKNKIYDFIALALKEKVKNCDKLISMLNDQKLVNNESSEKKDAENLLNMAKIFKDRKSAANGQLAGVAVMNMFDAIPTEYDIIKAISANNKYITDKGSLKKVIDLLIKDKQQILKDLDAAFKKLPVPAQVGGSNGKVAAAAPAAATGVKK